MAQIVRVFDANDATELARAMNTWLDEKLGCLDPDQVVFAVNGTTVCASAAMTRKGRVGITVTSDTTYWRLVGYHGTSAAEVNTSLPDDHVTVFRQALLTVGDSFWLLLFVPAPRLSEYA